MGVQSDDLPCLLDRVFSGDEHAAIELLEQFGPAVRCAVRRVLNDKLRSRYDSLDFVQDVWLAFLASGPHEGADDAKSLLALLKVLARNKVLEKSRQCFHSERHNIHAEFSLEEPWVVPDDYLDAGEPTPSEIVTGEEEMEQYLQSLPPIYRAVIQLLWEGCSVAQVAERLELDRRTVYRIIARCMKRKNPWS
jgi:RNA polymerase sigma factor (sigma-70 family)